MALQFKQLKSAVLGAQDKLTFGKFKDCRVCDVWDDHFEYLIWADKAGYVKFDKQVVTHLQEHGNFVAAQEHYKNEIQPWEDNKHDDFPDLPF